MKEVLLRFFKSQEVREFYRLMSYMKKRILVYGFTLVTASAVFAICLDIFMAIVLKGITNAAVSKDMKILNENLRLAGILIVFTSVVAPTSIYMCIKCIKKSMVEIRLSVFDHLTQLPMKYFDSNHSGGILSRLLSDINMMEYTYFFPLFNLLMSVILGVGSITFMFFLNWKISTLLILIGVLSVLVNTYLSKPLKDLSRSVQEYKGYLTEQLINVLSGSYIIKVFNIYDNLSKVFQEKNKKTSFLNLELNKKRALLESSNYVLGIFSFVGMVIVGIFLSINNVSNLGTSIACISLQGGVTRMFLNVGRFVAEIKSCLAGAGRVFELLDEPVESTYFCTAEENILNKEGILIKDVKFCYDDGDYILNGASLNIESGKFTIIVGGSGSGKSSLFKLLMGFYKPHSGSIHIDGQPIEKYPLKCLRDVISYVPQDPFLFNCSIIDNIMMGRSGATYDEVIAAAEIACAHEFITKLPEGYDTIVGENGSRLSGGQRQRIAIARAVLKKSPYILLDEATSALDSRTEAAVLGNLKKALKGQTLVLITHRSLDAQFADAVVAIDAYQCRI